MKTVVLTNSEVCLLFHALVTRWLRNLLTGIFYVSLGITETAKKCVDSSVLFLKFDDLIKALIHFWFAKNLSLFSWMLWRNSKFLFRLRQYKRTTVICPSSPMDSSLFTGNKTLSTKDWKIILSTELSWCDGVRTWLPGGDSWILTTVVTMFDSI